MAYAENVFSDVPHTGQSLPERLRTAKVLRWIGVLIVLIVLALAAWMLPQMLTADEGQTPAACSDTLPAQSSARAPAGTFEQTLTQPPSDSSAGAADAAKVDAAIIHTVDVEPAIATVSASVVAVVGPEGVDLWTGTDGLARSTLPNGTVLKATGRSDDGAWLYIATVDAAGWVQAASVIAFNVSSLPVLSWPATADLPADQGLSLASANVPEDALPVMETGAASPATENTAAVASAEPETTDSNVTATVSTAGASLNIRSGPGTGYSLLAKAEPNALLAAVGRNEAGDWVQVQLAAEGSGLGWVSAGYVQLSSPLSSLPTVDPPAAEPLDQSAVATLSQDTLAQASSATGLSGTLVIQQSNGGMIYAYDLESGDLWPLTYGFDPAISPDGGAVAFTRESAENGVYLIDIDGDNLRLIFSGHAGLRSPKWSTDGNWIVFSRTDEYEECVRIGSSCSTGGRVPEDATLSKEYDSTLAVIDYNGENYQDLATLYSARNPDWNEAGIVYQSAAGLQLTSNTPAATTQLIAYDWQKPYYQDPDWQPRPEGSRGLIVFQSREASHWEIFTVNANGSGLTALTQPSTTLVDELPSNVSPAWSPDGQSIAFLSNRSADGSAGEWQIMVMDADGGNQRTLPIDLDLDYTFGGEQMVDWGPASA